MPVRIHIPAPMRQYTDGQAIVEVQADSVLSAISALGAKYPAIHNKVIENGKKQQFVNLFLNDEDIRYLDNVQTAVKDGDELSIIPAIAGG